MLVALEIGCSGCSVLSIPPRTCLKAWTHSDPPQEILDKGGDRSFNKREALSTTTGEA